jgi:transposase
MASVRKSHTTEFKAKVAIEAIRQQKTTNALTAEYAVHATQINLWKKQALAAIPGAFSGKQEKVQENQQRDIDELHRQIGQLGTGFKKVLGHRLETRQLLVDQRWVIQNPATMQASGPQSFVTVLPTR